MVTAKQGNLYCRLQVLSDYTLSLWIGGSQGYVLIFQKNVRSKTEDNERLLCVWGYCVCVWGGDKLAQENLAMDPQHSISPQTQMFSSINLVVNASCPNPIPELQFPLNWETFHLGGRLFNTRKGTTYKSQKVPDTNKIHKVPPFLRLYSSKDSWGEETL